MVVANLVAQFEPLESAAMDILGEHTAPQKMSSPNEPPTAERTLDGGNTLSKTSINPQQSTINSISYLEAASLRY